MGIDTGSTIATLLNLKERLTALKESAEILKAKKSLQSKLSEFDLAKELSEIRKNIASKRNYQIERILEAFPDLEFKGFKAQINEFKSEIQKIKEDIKKQKLAIKERQKKLKIEKKNKKKNKIDNKENRFPLT